MTHNAEEQQHQERSNRLTHQTLFSGKIFTVEREEHPAKKTYDLVKHGPAVAILPVDTNGNLILIRQYRRAPDEILIEIPAGLIEPNEEIEGCARRELQEEIGYIANTLIPIGSFFTSPGFCDELVHIFIGKELTLSKLPHDEHEMIDLMIVSPSDALTLIEQKKIRDAKTLLALAYYFSFCK